MNTLNSSVNNNKSLLNSIDFANSLLTEKEVSEMPIEEVNRLFGKIKRALGDANVAKNEFMATTKLKQGTDEFVKEIAKFTVRKERINRNYLILETRLKEEKLKFMQTCREEAMFLKEFWTTAKTNLDNQSFNNLIDITEKKVKMPDSLI